jgi:hypothetical protein
MDLNPARVEFADATGCVLEYDQGSCFYGLMLIFNPVGVVFICYPPRVSPGAIQIQALPGF